MFISIIQNKLGDGVFITKYEMVNLCLAPCVFNSPSMSVILPMYKNPPFTFYNDLHADDSFCKLRRCGENIDTYKECPFIIEGGGLKGHDSQGNIYLSANNNKGDRLAWLQSTGQPILWSAVRILFTATELSCCDFVMSLCFPNGRQ
jgi:hypothetical protein